MNKIYLILAIFLCYNIVITSAVQETIISQLYISYDNSSKILKINGEGLNWNQQLNNSFTNTSLQLVMSREFGNMTEITDALSECIQNINCTQEYRNCQSLAMGLQIDMMKMVNLSDYQSCVNNITANNYQCQLEKFSVMSNATISINDANKLKDDSQSQKNWIMIIGAVGWAVALYFGYKYQIFGRRETFVDRDKPVDASF